jgi:hypothetical protein
MAGIDKIYGSDNEYDTFKHWCKKNSSAKRRHLKHFFYPRDDYEDKSYRPITNFPEKHDKWLLNHCPFDFIIKRIEKQY